MEGQMSSTIRIHFRQAGIWPQMALDFRNVFRDALLGLLTHVQR